MTAKRCYRPISVERDAALHALGLLGKKINWDHCPALGMRLRTPDGGYIPDENDPRYIVPRLAEDHAVKTNGNHVPLSGDKSQIAKLKRNESAEAEYRFRILAKAPGTPREKSSKWPKRKFQQKRKSNVVVT
jgi:hypothetical protein